MTDESVIEWASDWVHDEPPGQRQRFADGLQLELADRVEKFRATVRDMDANIAKLTKQYNEQAQRAERAEKAHQLADKALRSLAEAIERVGDWDAETRVGHALTAAYAAMEETAQ